MRVVDTGVLRGIRVQSRSEEILSFVLPDGIHAVHIHNMRFRVYCTVVHDVTMESILEFPIDKNKTPNWEDLVQGFCEKACSHFPKAVRHGSVNIERQRRGW